MTPSRNSRPRLGVPSVGAVHGMTGEGDGRGLVVNANSLEAAEAFYNLLWRYHPELVTSHSDGYQIRVDLASDSHLIAALTAVHEYITKRNDPTCIELEGRSYTLQPE